MSSISIAAGVVAVLEADVVEHEELGFRADEDGVADAGLLEIGFGAGRGRARIAAVKLAGRGLDDVAEQDQHRSRAERIDIGGVEVGLQDHVELVDRLPAGDRASVEHEAVGQHVLVDHARRHGQVLPLALGIGEAEVDPVDLLVLDPRKDGACVVRHVNRCPRSSFQSIGARTKCRLGPACAPARTSAIRAWDSRFPTRGRESGGQRIFHRRHVVQLSAIRLASHRGGRSC